MPEMDISYFGQSRLFFWGGCRACIIIQFPDMSSGNGFVSLLRQGVSYNQDSLSSKKISSCE